MFFNKEFKILVIIILSLLYSCDNVAEMETVYSSENLIIEKVSAHVYMHISYLNTEKYGRVPCNGMLVVDENEAIVFDTPTSNEASLELIDWFKKNLNSKVRAVVVSHFHVDALGGLKGFHDNDITSFANKATIEIAKKKELEVPNYGITSSYEHSVGNKKLISLFVGEAHSKDNIVGYFPDEDILFGSCMVKAIGAKKGNLEDANVEEWPKTIEKLTVMLPNAKIIIPGHGTIGGKDLLQYTIDLFKND